MVLTKDSVKNERWEENLLEELERHLGAKHALFGQVLSGNTGIHLAVFKEPYLSYVLEGKKSVESRFSINRCAPFNQVAAGDVLLLKKAAGPIVAACTVDYVWSYNLDISVVEEIRRRFTNVLCAQDPEFWHSRTRSKYATLMRVRDVVEVPAIECAKRDRRGWVVLQQRSTLPFSLEEE